MALDSAFFACELVPEGLWAQSIDRAYVKLATQKVSHNTSFQYHDPVYTLAFRLIIYLCFGYLYLLYLVYC